MISCMSLLFCMASPNIQTWHRNRVTGTCSWWFSLNSGSLYSSEVAKETNHTGSRNTNKHWIGAKHDLALPVTLQFISSASWETNARSFLPVLHVSPCREVLKIVQQKKKEDSRWSSTEQGDEHISPSDPPRQADPEPLLWAPKPALPQQMPTFPSRRCSGHTEGGEQGAGVHQNLCCLQEAFAAKAVFKC